MSFTRNLIRLRQPGKLSWVNCIGECRVGASKLPNSSPNSGRTTNSDRRLPEDLGELEPAASLQRRLGKALLKRVGRRYGESLVHLLRAGSRQGAVIWRVCAGREEAQVTSVGLVGFVGLIPTPNV